MWRITAWALFIAAFLAMIAVLLGVLPAYTFAEYIPMALAILGIIAILIHDSRKGSRNG